MITIHRVWPVCFVFCGILPVSAHAALMLANDPHLGAGSITQDTETGLEWLDVTLSANRSYNQVVAQLGTGGQFAGFRYGTQAEVDLLFRHAGFAHTDATLRASDFSIAQSFMSLVGITASSQRGDAVLGLTAELAGTLTGVGARKVFSGGTELPPFSNPAKGTAIALDFTGSITVLDSNASEFRGSWLVRPIAATVPEPTSFLIFSVALTFTAPFLRRRQSTKR